MFNVENPNSDLCPIFFELLDNSFKYQCLVTSFNSGIYPKYYEEIDYLFHLSNIQSPDYSKPWWLSYV